MHRALRTTALAATLGAVLLAGCSGAAEDAANDPARATTEPSTVADASPVVLRECFVPTGGGGVSLSNEEARTLTSRAAALAGRAGQPTARGRDRLTAVVARTITSDDTRAADPVLTAAGGVTATARLVADGLAGVKGSPRLVCSPTRGDVEPQQIGRSGLIPRARLLRADWTEVFGPLSAGGFARGGVSTGHVDGSAHYEGRAIDVFFRPFGDPEQARRGWVFAQWLVAHAADHAVLAVIYDDHIWTSWASYAGWRDYVHPGASFNNRGNAVLRHREHVHVAVESGRPWRPR